MAPISSRIVNGVSLPSLPWEERLEGSDAVIWRSARNPIIPCDLIPSSNSIFNSAVVPYHGAYAGVFRCDTKARTMQLHAGRSVDGVIWSIDNDRIQFQPANAQTAEINAFQYAYDPRVVWIEDRYYVTWCNGYHGPTIGVGYTHDFATFYQLENAYLPFNRNGVLFPRKINGRYAMFSRPSGNGRHTVYFNDAETLRQRLQAAFERHPDLAGVAIWALGGEDPENWTIISQSDRKEDNRQ